MNEQAEISPQTGTPGEHGEPSVTASPTKSPTVCSRDVLDRVDGFTLVFDGDLSSFVGNPFNVQTPFGKARACGLGDAFAKEQDAVDVADALAEALLKMMSAMPPNGRTCEQIAAMVASGRAISRWRDL
jgi:hypothetical protein